MRAQKAIRATEAEIPGELQQTWDEDQGLLRQLEGMPRHAIDDSVASATSVLHEHLRLQGRLTSLQWALNENAT